MPDWISHEPAMWLAVITALLDLAVAFGAPITPDQRVAILGAGGAVLAIIGGVAVRQNVVPVAKLKDQP